MGVIVKGLRYVQKIEHVKGHLKYIGFRSNELANSKAREEYGLDNTKFFSKDTNNADYKAFISRIENHKALKHSKSVKMHKMIFSLKQEDFKNYLSDSDGKDFKDLVRKTLDHYSKFKGQQFDWIAVEHITDGNKLSTHPHVHVAIKGVTEQGERVKFVKEDYQFLREKFDVEYNKVCEYESNWEYGQRQSRGLTPLQTLEKDIANSTKKIFKEMERDVEKTRYERFKIQSEEQKRAKRRDIERQLSRSF